MTYVTVVEHSCEDEVIAYVFHAHRHADGSPPPDGSMIEDNVLIFPLPVPADSGDYICFSGSANFTYSLLVEDPLTTSPMTSPTTSPVTSPVTSPLPVEAGGQKKICHSPSRLHDYCMC